MMVVALLTGSSEATTTLLQQHSKSHDIGAADFSFVMDKEKHHSHHHKPKHGRHKGLKVVDDTDKEEEALEDKQDRRTMDLDKKF